MGTEFPGARKYSEHAVGLMQRAPKTSGRSDINDPTLGSLLADEYGGSCTITVEELEKRHVDSAAESKDNKFEHLKEVLLVTRGFVMPSVGTENDTVRVAPFDAKNALDSVGGGGLWLESRTMKIAVALSYFSPATTVAVS